MGNQPHIALDQLVSRLKVTIFIFFRHSLSCSIVNGDKNVFKTHLKSFLDTSYV